MTAGTATEQEMIVQAVRGERLWTDLEPVGIRFHREGNRCTPENTRGIKAVATLRDLAHGLLAHLHDLGALKNWAFFLEAESFIDWAEGEDDPSWELLWDAVWCASFGDPIPDESIQQAKRIV